jgi:uncharacterized protein YjbI with pentapeptide repeats
MRRVSLLSVAAATALAVSGAALVSPGVASASGCPSVDPLTHAVSPAPSAGVNWSGCPLPLADLSGADLSAADLSGAALEQANLSDANLTRADLTETNLYYTYLARTNLTRADLSGANLSRAWTDLNGANLTQADLTDANLTGAELYGALLTATDLTGANLTDTVLQQASLARANLTSGLLHGTDLNHADLPDANLAQADLAGAYLYDTELSGANLTGANVASAGGCCNDLFGAILTDATVSGDFTLSTFGASNLTRASLDNADLDGATGCGIVGTGYSLPIGYNIVSGCLAFTGTYAVSAFGRPVDNPPVVNVATPGKAVPFNFTVSYPSGRPVQWLGTATPSSWSHACRPSANRDTVEWYTKAKPGLVNLGSGSYRYNFPTKTGWAGTCRTLRISLGDGVKHTASFRFTR